MESVAQKHIQHVTADRESDAVGAESDTCTGLGAILLPFQQYPPI